MRCTGYDTQVHPDLVLLAICNYNKFLSDNDKQLHYSDSLLNLIADIDDTSRFVGFLIESKKSRSVIKYPSSIIYFGDRKGNNFIVKDINCSDSLCKQSGYCENCYKSYRNIIRRFNDRHSNDKPKSIRKKIDQKIDQMVSKKCKKVLGKMETACKSKMKKIKKSKIKVCNSRAYDISRKQFINFPIKSLLSGSIQKQTSRNNSLWILSNNPPSFKYILMVMGSILFDCRVSNKCKEKNQEKISNDQDKISN